MNNQHEERTGWSSSSREYDGDRDHRASSPDGVYDERFGRGVYERSDSHEGFHGEGSHGRHARSRESHENEVVQPTRGAWGGATMGRSGLGGGMRHSGMATFGWSDFDAGSSSGGWRTRRAAPRRASSSGSHESDSADTSLQTSEPKNHSGRGPKGYRRSDARIQEDVCELLKNDHEVDASEIEVRVQNGIVTMSGTVSDRRSKRLAEQCIEDVAGVDDVSNEVRVSSSRSDASM